jgi:hypothetical protein
MARGCEGRVEEAADVRTLVGRYQDEVLAEL